MRIAPALTPVVTLVIAGSAAAGSFELSEPVAPAPREIVETGREPVYYRLPPKTVHFLSRSSLGMHTRLTGENDFAFTLDLLTGAMIRFGRPSAFGLWVEGGYSYVKGREHLAVFGVGLAHRKAGLGSTGFALVPHVIAGRIDDESRIGIRTSLIAGAFELAHQIAFTTGEPIHEIHLALTFPFVSGTD
jgi:hypothetical protein